jgi:AcrR family transcriptional regulator
MTREDIISAAFEVWGKDLYRTNSLSDIAMRLGVTKPAIYRHFAGKDALKEAMYEVFFDKAAEFLRGHWEKLRALSAAGKKREFYRTFALSTYP